MEIVNADNYEHEGDNIIVDWDNLCEKEYSEKDSSGSYVGLWLDGDKEMIQEKFQQLQVEVGIDFDGRIYDDVMEQSDRTVPQWTTIMHIVLAMLSGVVLGAILGIVVVAGLWKNNVITNTPITIDWEYIVEIVVYLFGLSFMLYPTIKKIG